MNLIDSNKNIINSRSKNYEQRCILNSCYSIILHMNALSGFNNFWIKTLKISYLTLLNEKLIVNDNLCQILYKKYHILTQV